jgi:hypothetical protein
MINNNEYKVFGLEQEIKSNERLFHGIISKIEVNPNGIISKRYIIAFLPKINYFYPHENAPPVAPSLPL